MATLVSDLSGENITPQMVKNIEAGRKRVDAAMLPVFAAAQRKSFAYYLLDDPAPGGYDLALIEAGLSPSKVVPLRKQKVVRSQIIPQVPQREAA